MKKIKELYNKYKEVISYLIFGVLTTIVNFILYFVFTKVLTIDEIISNGLAWFFSVLFAYITNKAFVFESKGKFLKEMISFFIARIASGILCDIGTFALMVKVLHIDDTVSKVITQIMVVVLNYIFSKLIVFKNSKKIGKN
ncbi:MAG: GtrA family protein [Clostridia bacterium]|nr:GtrA family protein [Clostridia bacterium]